MAPIWAAATIRFLGMVEYMFYEEGTKVAITTPINN
jgi:hypothetical protein